MLKPIAVLTGAAGDVAKPTTVDQKTATHVFRVLFGFYGNLFLSKFASGQLSPTGDDLGVLSARKVWAHGMRAFDTAVVYSALDRCQTTHAEYPPSWPQFLTLLRACKPVEVCESSGPRLQMSETLQSQYARRAREINAKHDQRVIDQRTGYVDLPKSLDGLKQAIAGAVALAGGDEGATLLRLDRELAPRQCMEAT